MTRADSSKPSPTQQAWSLHQLFFAHSIIPSQLLLVAAGIALLPGSAQAEAPIEIQAGQEAEWTQPLEVPGAGALRLQLYIVNNHGTLTSRGTSYDTEVIGNTLNNFADGKFYNYGKLAFSESSYLNAIDGIDYADRYGVLNNEGYFENATGGSLSITVPYNSTVSRINNTGIFLNNGTIEIGQFSSLKNAKTLTNNGEIAGGKLIQNEGSITNNGRISKVFNIENNGTFVNDGSIEDSQTAGIISNSKNFINNGSISQSWDAKIANLSGAVFENYGDIDYSLANSQIYIFNDGTFSNSGKITYLTGGGLENNGLLLNSGLIGITTANSNIVARVLNNGTLSISSVDGKHGDVQANIIGGAASSLIFDRLADYTYKYVLSGSGQITKRADTTLTLIGDSSKFTGTTNVESGTLVIGLAGATKPAALGGDVNVFNGATLSGVGSIGTAAVPTKTTIQSGGRFAAGSAGATLTVNGDFTMAQDSFMSVDVGAPGGASASAHVTGDLTLNGATLTVRDSGGYGVGLYRLFSYEGEYRSSNGGLILGATPAGTTAQIQVLSNSKQINLFNTTGLKLNLWNANGQAQTDKQLGGGSGVWSRNAAVWIDETLTSPSVGALQPQPGFAIFGGASGTVIVDNSEGAIQVAGMQFASSGYILNGQALTLVAQAGGSAPVEIRVDDGSIAGSSYLTTINNTLAGTQGLAKTGAGALVLNGDNTFTGGAFLNAGALSISTDTNLGDAGNALTINGGTLRATQQITTARRIALNGAATFDVAGPSLTLQGPIAGLGSLTKTGAGTLELSGNANTYTGQTTVSSGILRAGAQNAFSPESAYVLGNASSATLDLNNFDQTIASLGGGGKVSLGGATLNTGGNNTNTDYAGVIGGAGQLSKTGGGTLTLSGVNTYTGATTVSGGGLTVNGSIASSAMLSVGAGATLAGSGKVGSTRIASGAFLAPGDANTTFTVNGDLTMAKGAVYKVYADPGSARSTLVNVSGAAALEGGTTMHMGPDSKYQRGLAYTILSAAKGVSGQFDRVESNYAYLTPSLSYTPNAVTMELVRRDSTPEFADAAKTGNQSAVANALESLGSGNALYQFIETLPIGTPPAVLNSLSGDVHASAGAALQSSATGSRTLTLQKLRNNLAATPRPGAATAQAGISDAPALASSLPQDASSSTWVEIIGNWQSANGDDNAAGSTQRTGGVSVGADRPIGDNGWRIGGAFGYTDSALRVKDRSAESDISSYSATLYAGKAFDAGAGKLNLLVGASYTWHNIDSQRNINIAELNQSLKADYSASTSQLFTELGYAVPVGDVTVEPFVGLAWSDQRTRGFSESGGSAALSARSQRDDQTTSTLGLRAETPFSLGQTSGTVRASVGWRHAFAAVTTQSTMSFMGSQPFTVTGTPMARDVALIELGTDVAISRNALLAVSYGGQFGHGSREHSGTLSVRWQF